MNNSALEVRQRSPASGPSRACRPGSVAQAGAQQHRRGLPAARGPSGVQSARDRTREVSAADTWGSPTGLGRASGTIQHADFLPLASCRCRGDIWPPLSSRPSTSPRTAVVCPHTPGSWLEWSPRGLPQTSQTCIPSACHRLLDPSSAPWPHPACPSSGPFRADGGAVTSVALALSLTPTSSLRSGFRLAFWASGSQEACGRRAAQCPAGLALETGPTAKRGCLQCPVSGLSHAVCPDRRDPGWLSLSHGPAWAVSPALGRPPYGQGAEEQRLWNGSVSAEDPCSRRRALATASRARCGQRPGLHAQPQQPVWFRSPAMLALDLRAVPAPTAPACPPRRCEFSPGAPHRDPQGAQRGGCGGEGRPGRGGVAQPDRCSRIVPLVSVAGGREPRASKGRAWLAGQAHQADRPALIPQSPCGQGQACRAGSPRPRLPRVWSSPAGRASGAAVGGSRVGRCDPWDPGRGCISPGVSGAGGPSDESGPRHRGSRSPGVCERTAGPGLFNAPGHVTLSTCPLRARVPSRQRTA